MKTQSEKAEAFHALHYGDRAFIIPNPWDAGSARMLAYEGFAALATTSMGHALSIGQLDNTLTREQTLANCTAIVAATDLPVSADLENGFGHKPQTVYETIGMAAATGLVGGSIEDASGEAARPIYEISHAVERIQAAVAAARALPFRFTLTARAENYLWGRPDLDDTIKRLQAYEEAGADVLYAPGLTTREEITAVVSAVGKPVNVVMGLTGVQLTLSELSEMGVKRISVGSSLCRTAYGALIRGAREMRDQGTFTFASAAVSLKELGAILK